ncbi:MAG: hypothetical protein P4N59_11525 [Negativicutes bacterium]|nr:hypothetical protein [Negativicutes bacterium]
MSATQNFTLYNQPAGTYVVGTGSTFPGSGGGVLGGRYVFLFCGTGAGTAVLNTLGPDGVTWVPASTSITANANAQLLDLCPGQYQIVITGFTANYASLTRIAF